MNEKRLYTHKINLQLKFELYVTNEEEATEMTKLICERMIKRYWSTKEFKIIDRTALVGYSVGIGHSPLC